MKVLIWHDDNGLVVYDASDEAKAYRAMFNDMDFADYWSELSEPIIETEPSTPDTGDVRRRRLYQKAKAGDDKAARELCVIASGEGWEYQGSGLYPVK